MHVYPNYFKEILLFFLTEYKNKRKLHKFWQQKNDFYNNKNKKIFNIDDIDFNKRLASKKEQYGKYILFKYFIGYNNNDVIRPLWPLCHKWLVILKNLMKIKMKIKTE